MFSSDRNIEIIGKLIETAKHYLGLQAEYAKLGAIDKTVRLVTALIVVAMLALIIILVLIFMSLALTVAIAQYLGYAWAFCIVGLLYFLVFVMFLLFKKALIEKPLVKFLTTLLLEN